MNNVSLINNYADIGGALFCRGNDVSLVNVTISKNVAARYDGNILDTDSSTLIVNSIVWNNSPDQIDSSLINAFYCDIKHGWPGIGNINTDPMFVDSINNDFRLQASSPCIDAGIQDTMIVYNDGQDTLIIPPMDYIGSAPDMGAYEYGDPLAVEQETIKLPNRYTLSQNYPNPFNPSTTIEFSIPKTEFVILKIYNILGKEVATLVSEKLAAGKYRYTWDASGFASGIYIYQLKAKGQRQKVTYP